MGRDAGGFAKAGCASAGLVFPGAARSTCGRPAAVVCCVAADPACDGDDACGGTTARIARDEATCTAAGGAPDGQGSVCGACTDASTTSSTVTSTTSTTIVTTSTTSSSTTTTLAAGADYGNDVEFPAASAHAPDYLLGSPIVLPQPSTLTHLCVIAKSGGPHVILGLYTDSGDSPDGLVASIPATAMVAGRMEMPVAPTPLAPGTYWIMGVYDADASIGIDETDPGAPVCYTSHSFATALPDPFGPASPYSGQKFNYYIRVE